MNDWSAPTLVATGWWPPGAIRRDSRTLTNNVVATGSSIATASVVTLGHQASAASPSPSVPIRCAITSDDSTSLRESPR